MQPGGSNISSGGWRYLQANFNLHRKCFSDVQKPVAVGQNC